MTLKVTPSEVYAKSGQIKTQKGIMEGLIGQIYAEITSLPEGAWNSQSGRKFVERFANVKQNSLRTLEVIYAHATNLSTAAQKYEELEARQEANVGGLSDGFTIS
ncbi:MAG: WXG100 family type VII secretion target [Firmicutes bacterium]|nr:WXG100 family type VII secretion target [Bacillota bacterium]